MEEGPNKKQQIRQNQSHPQYHILRPGTREYRRGDNLTTYGLYNLSDMRLKQNVTPLSILSKELSPLAKLQNLEVIEYSKDF